MQKQIMRLEDVEVLVRVTKQGKKFDVGTCANAHDCTIYSKSNQRARFDLRRGDEVAAIRRWAAGGCRGYSFPVNAPVRVAEHVRKLGGIES